MADENRWLSNFLETVYDWAEMNDFYPEVMKRTDEFGGLRWSVSLRGRDAAGDFRFIVPQPPTRSKTRDSSLENFIDSTLRQIRLRLAESIAERRFYKSAAGRAKRRAA